MKTFLLVARNSLQSRWMIVVAGFFIMSVSGSIYAFGVYSQALKSSLGYNQKTLTTVGFFKDFGNIGILAGLLADIFPAWVVLSVGVTFNTFGYLMIWLSVTKRIAKPALWQMYLYITFGGNSVAFTHAGALVTCVKDFPLHRGMIVGLLKGFLGLSAAILTLVYRAIYGNEPKSFILLIIYLPFAVILVFMFFIRPVNPPSGRVEDEVKVFYRLFIMELLVAGYLMMVIIVQQTVHVGKSVNGVFAGLLAALMCVPFGMVFRMEIKKLRETTRNGSSDIETLPRENGEVADTYRAAPPAGGDDDSSDVTKDDKALARIEPRDSSEDENNQGKESGGGGTENGTNGSVQTHPSSSSRTLASFFKTPPIGHDFSVWQALVHPDFWLLSVASTAGLGAGLMLIDNLGQIGASYGYDPEKTTTFVSLISIWNCLGRVCSGFVSEYFLQRNGLARPFFYALALAVSAFGYLAIALDVTGALFFGSILIGLCFGAQWALLHIMVSEVFGLKYYGTLQSIIAMASPLGTYLLSVRVAGYLYDRETDRQQAALGVRHSAGGKDVTCHGNVCFRKSLLIMCAACSGACLLMLVMVFRTRRFYKREVYENLKNKKLEMVKAKEEAAAQKM